MGNELRKNKSQDPKFEDFIELNDLNEPIEHRRNQVKVFVPTIEEGKGMDEPIIEDIETKFDNIGYNEDECSYSSRALGCIVPDFGNNVSEIITLPVDAAISEDDFNLVINYTTSTSNYRVLGRYGVSVPTLHKKPRRTEELYA
ncbi:hypothetical protein Tco_0827362, partial [Tanacetum coccineum]